MGGPGGWLGCSRVAGAVAVSVASVHNLTSETEVDIFTESTAGRGVDCVSCD